MLKRTSGFRVLLIDDDKRMNERLKNILSGLQLSTENTTVKTSVDVVQVELELDPADSGRCRFSEDTLREIERLSRQPRYDLVVADYGFLTEGAKDVIWGRDRSKHPTKEDFSEAVLTIGDLRGAFENHTKVSGSNRFRSGNIFTASRRVILRSMTSRLAEDLVGPVVPDRVNEARNSFLNAKIVPLDPRQEVYANDHFYEFYEHQKGREFYRYLVGTISARMVESEILRSLLGHAGKMHLWRSVANIALFGAAVTFVGMLANFLGNEALGRISSGEPGGWWFALLGFLVVLLGALVLAFGFERLTRTVIRWVGPEDGFAQE